MHISTTITHEQKGCHWIGLIGEGDAATMADLISRYMRWQSLRSDGWSFGADDE